MYTARWLKREKVLDSETYLEKDDAVRKAVERLPAYTEMLGATAAEVVDEGGARHLLHPAPVQHKPAEKPAD